MRKRIAEGDYREPIAEGYYRLEIPTTNPPDEAKVKRLVSAYFGAEERPAAQGGSIKWPIRKLES
jgi:hypothetical protein